jgi:hypothetical protein
VVEQCCNPDPGHLLFQINVICLLLFLIGTAAIVKHPVWFGGVPVASQSMTER